MSVLNQKTIREIIKFEGIGLHSGKKVLMTLFPALPNSGIIFKRSDLKKNNLIYPSVFNVSSASYCTKLTNEYGVSVSTVEHLMAALCGLGIDNLLIDLNSEELPIMDGSAKDFLSILQQAGIMTQTKKRKYLKILNSFDFSDGTRKIRIEPNEKSFEVDFELHYNNKIIGNQKNKINFTKDNLEDLIESRTFCLYEDIEKIKNIGLAQGGSLDNAIVVKDEKILNVNGLRNKKEFVNHKILDLAGDFILAGYNILGKVECYKGGHEFSNLFLREILDKNKHNFEIIEFKEKETKKISQKGYFTGLAVNA